MFGYTQDDDHSSHVFDADEPVFCAGPSSTEKATCGRYVPAWRAMGAKVAAPGGRYHGPMFPTWRCEACTRGMQRIAAMARLLAYAPSESSGKSTV